ncbi:MAG: aminotransferase class I and II [Deltaproteobacteria bacterium HGW-Deltaproteobacteria-4]|nr:MAG: aminotransferase class I and II [Deltaproteobacteria bacterium HGW-Deltaproteobacteria-4]
MPFSLSPALAAIQPPPITEVKSWIADHTFPPEKPLIDLCQAIPDYPPAQTMMKALTPLLHDPDIAKYSPDEGLTAVRQSIANWYERRYGAGPQATEICLTVGASQAFWLAMLTLCRAGDEVIVPLPAYFDHPMALAAYGVVPRYLPYIEGSGGLPDPAQIAAAITARTRVILLVSPSNPTGAILPPALLRELFELAQRRNIALVLDETYNTFVPPVSRHDLFSTPEWGDHFVQIASFGKTYALTGYRAGALVASETVIHAALKVQDSMVVCAPRLTQHAIAWGCDHLDAWVDANARMMQERHDLFRTSFTVAGNRFCISASGAFFAWVRHPFTGQSGRQVARRLALEENLICLPGEAFGPGLEGYLRLAFGNITAGAIPAAVQRFCAL